ncbi:ribonuclease inhibitor [Izhakiella capsodis]|uniref:Ribonuclease inhibitor n=1 Tax=Izhakiella capsodis TaxID=1367852 RepID=A0A1I4VB17_9GAMM|nr:barstar family protein [Izhakiella capsodis]SFM98382.1 ribonuclease inhibitor [Izhakiella capsodis]
MIQQLNLDFRHIADMPEFYRQFAALLDLDDGFGANLDALWDTITSEITLPLHLSLQHWQQHADPQQFNDLIILLKDAEKETAGAFRLSLV